MKISRGGVEWACLWYIPMFRFPGVKRGDGVFSSCFGTCCLYFEGGVEGGGRRLVVRLCSEYIIFCFNNSWGAVVGDGSGVSWGAKPGHG